MTKENQQLNLPPFIEQVENFAVATKDVILGFLKGGKIKASSQMMQDRMEICLACDKLTQDFRCAQCGCLIKVKAQLFTQDCPLRKWPHKEY